MAFTPICIPSDYHQQQTLADNVASIAVTETDENPDWNRVSYVLSSEMRLRLLTQLSKGEATPGHLATMLDKNSSHVSRGLSEVSEQDLVVCLTPGETKGRIYSITDQGFGILDQINSMTDTG